MSFPHQELGPRRRASDFRRDDAKVIDTRIDSSGQRFSRPGAAGAGAPDSAWSMLDEELVRAQRVASDSVEPGDLDWLCRGFSAFLASGGKLPLERCLRLPTNERALRRARRDHWLRLAWLQIGGSVSAWRRSEMLAVEIHRFQSGKWLRWLELDEAPAGSNALETDLFEAFKSYERVPNTAMQLHNIAGQCRRA
jgi:hypothetical protein